MSACLCSDNKCHLPHAQEKTQMHVCGMSNLSLTVGKCGNYP